MILATDLNALKSNAKFWCEAAANARVQHESVFNLKLKMLAGDENKDTKQVEEMIVKEVNNRPSEVSPRLQLVNYYLSKNRSEDAFKYVSDIMSRNPGQFLNSLEWYATVHKTLKQFKQATDVVLSKNWDYWVLSLTAVDRQLSLSLAQDHQLASQQSGHLQNCQALLFDLDQMLYTAANISFPVRTELSAQLINHFQGQFLLHAATFLYARERNTNQWWATINNALPLLFLAFRLGVASTEDAWLKQANEQTRELVRLWQRQGAFRCSQAGRTLLSCIEDDDAKKGQSGNVAPFKTAEDLTDAARKHCSSRNWTTTLFRHLFTNEDQVAKTGTSFMTTSNLLAEPTFELPSVLRIQMYERMAESLQSDSLSQLVYLYLHTEKLSESDFNVFSGLELTTSNIFNCSPASLNKLDIETFLIATVQQTRSRLAMEHKTVDGPRPTTLPYANMARHLCTEEQRRWWQCAYSSTMGTNCEEIVNVREILQDGIEAVRCVGTPKMDLMIALLTGDILKQKTDNNLAIDLTTKKAYEQRAENIFQCALHWFKNQATTAVVDKRRLFQYHSKTSVVGTDDCVALLEGAVIFLAEQYFRQTDYETCVEVLTNVQLPYATYYIAEAYKKMDEEQRNNNRTPSRSSSGVYQGKVKQFLGQTQKLLASNSKKNHSLRTVVSNELKKLQFSDLNMSSASVDEDALNVSYPATNALNRSTRHESSSVVSDQVSALTALVTQLTMQNTMLQTEMSDIKKMLQQQKETSSLNDSLFRLEEQQQRLFQHHSPHYDYMNGRYSMGGAAGYPYHQGMPFPGGAPPSQFPPHLRGPGSMYGADANSLAMAQANAGMAVMPTYDPITGTLMVSPAAPPPNPQGFYPNSSVSAMGPSSMVVPPGPSHSILANQLQQPPLASSSTVEQVFTGNSILKTWNSTYNNEPVEKGAPANVVITSSDPVPMHNNTVTAPKLLSVTIPPQHIKNYTGGITAKPSDAGHQFPSVISGTFSSNQSSTLSHNATNISGDETATEEDYYDEQGGDYCEDPSLPPVVPTTITEELPKQPEPTVKPTSEVKFGFGQSSSSATTTAADNSTKPSPFTNFTFGKAAETASPEKPFNNLFGNLAKPTTTSSPEKPFASIFGNLSKPTTENTGLFGFSSTPTATSNNTPAKEPAAASVTSPAGKGANNDDAEDDYVPTAQFKPVIELPSLIEVKTGEEDETVAFEHRAKLLRFDTTTKEWKERGLGNIRIMVRKDDPSQVRLLMRREQVLKLACNQRVTKDQVFNKMPNSETALSWYAQDFAENELKTELFAIRFKTSDICKSFHDHILRVQANMKEPAQQVAVPAAKAETEKKGFGDMFKKQQGSWECQGCLVVNKSDTLHCVACDAPKDDTVPKKDSKPKGVDLSGVKPGQFTFGFGVKPAAAPAAVPSTEVAQNLTVTKKESAPAAPTIVPAASEAVKGFGDAFKPKAGSWECQTCYITNKADDQKCVSCATSKDGKPDDGKQLGGGGLSFSAAAASGGAFSFGTGKSTFSFGATSQASTAPTNSSPFANLFGTTPSPASTTLFGQPAAQPADGTANGPSFGLDSKPTFDFVFKPKSPGKLKSPQKMTNGGADEEPGSDDEHVEEEENTAYFTPVIPLPDKVEAKTGEEDEEVLYSHRAKLFRFTDGEWKERGLGEVKILKHSVTGKLRVVMRREQVLKICLNHVLDESVEYKVKDNKSWLFVANDFSEGVLELMQFSLRFKTPEIATEFKEAVDAARGGSESEPKESVHQMDEDEKAVIKELSLPKDFFDYHVAEKCPGCRGCNDDAFVYSTSTSANSGSVFDELPLKMPALPATVKKSETGDLAKNIFGGFNQSLTNSPGSDSQNLFGSTNLFSGSPQKSTSIFGGSTTFGQPAVAPDAATDTEGKPSLFSGLNTSFGSPGTAAGSLFGSKPVFGSALGTVTTEPAKDTTTTSIFGQNSVFGTTATTNTATGNSTFGSFNFGTAAPSLGPSTIKESTAEVETKKETDGGSIFKMDSNFSFATLAQQDSGSVFNSKPAGAPSASGFFGLSNTNDFRHFNNPGAQSNGNGDAQDESVEDANYDPHYEPIIALPEEISVSTGEEEETKLFGERGRLYRFDSTNKEWKERGSYDKRLIVCSACPWHDPFGNLLVSYIFRSGRVQNSTPSRQRHLSVCDAARANFQACSEPCHYGGL